jgi:hypothetical protein
MSFWHENIFCTHFEEQPIAAKTISSINRYVPYTWPGDNFLGVALPDRKALGMKVAIIREPYEVIAECVDIGPWAIDDSEYVFGSARPRAEIYKGKPCPINRLSTGHASIPNGRGGWIRIGTSNGAGLDIMPGTARALGLKINENSHVDWKFIAT